MNFIFSAILVAMEPYAYPKLTCAPSESRRVSYIILYLLTYSIKKFKEKIKIRKKSCVVKKEEKIRKMTQLFYVPLICVVTNKHHKVVWFYHAWYSFIRCYLSIQLRNSKNSADLFQSNHSTSNLVLSFSLTHIKCYKGLCRIGSMLHLDLFCVLFYLQI